MLRKSVSSLKLIRSFCIVFTLLTGLDETFAALRAVSVNIIYDTPLRLTGLDIDLGARRMLL